MRARLYFSVKGGKNAEKVTVLHQMLIVAMKCKQTTDPDHVATLRTLLKKFETLRPKPTG